MRAFSMSQLTIRRPARSPRYWYCAKDGVECYGGMFLGWQRDGRVAAQKGDSGGPVYRVSGSTTAQAKGTISGASDDGTMVVFQDFWTANQDFGIRPK